MHLSIQFSRVIGGSEDKTSLNEVTDDFGAVTQREIAIDPREPHVEMTNIAFDCSRTFFIALSASLSFPNFVMYDLRFQPSI